MKRAMSGESVSWASLRSCDKCELRWLSNASIHQLMDSSSDFRLIFEKEALKEEGFIKIVDDNIDVEESTAGKEDNNRGSINGSFIIPHRIILNNVDVINFKDTQELLQNVDLIDDESEIVITTYKTVTIDGKSFNGQDNYVYKHEWQRWIINPHCQYKLIFDLVIVVMVLISSLTVPYRMGFAISSTRQWSIIDGITESFFSLDLVLAFLTAFEYKDSTLDTSFKHIASRYLRSWFLIDFLSAVPLYRITTGQSSIGIVVRLLKTLKLGRLFRLFKVFKFARVAKIFKLSNLDFVPNEFIAIENSFGQMFKLFAYLGFTTHIIACIFSWISIDSRGPTWATDTADVGSTFERYIAAQYWTFATMATVGKYELYHFNSCLFLSNKCLFILRVWRYLCPQ